MALGGWRAVDDAPGYEVSAQGQVRSWLPFRGTPTPRILKPWPKGPKGHLAVSLRVSDKRLVRLVHRLVMAAFVGPCPHGMEVRHLDGDSTNNVLSNLAYGTHSENELDKLRHGTHGNARKTHCPEGHPYDGKAGHSRRCSRCDRAGRRRRYYAFRAEGLSARCASSLHATCDANRTPCKCDCHTGGRRA